MTLGLAAIVWCTFGVGFSVGVVFCLWAGWGEMPTKKEQPNHAMSFRELHAAIERRKHGKD